MGRFAAFVMLLLGCPLPAGAQEAVHIEVLSTQTISQQPQFYHGWPTLARRSDGTLMVAYSGGRDFHVCPFGRLELIQSRDEGRTWTMPRVLADSAIDDRDSGLIETAKGTLLATMFNSTAYQIHMNAPARLIVPTFGKDSAEKMLARWRTQDAITTPAQKEAEAGYWMLRSTDGGQNWSPRYRVPGYSPHGPVNLRDGRLFYATSNGRKAIAYASADDGLTWQELSEMPVRAGELHAVEAADGAIIVQVRDKTFSVPGSRFPVPGSSATEPGAKEKSSSVPVPGSPLGASGKAESAVQPQAPVKGRTVQSTAQILSTDGGKTWSEKQKVADGYPSHLLRLRDAQGTLLMVYGWRADQPGIRGKVSHDHGRTWSAEFILTQDAASWDVGYPSSAELADGTLLTVWYETPPPGNDKDSSPHRAVLRQAKWKLSF